MNIELCHDGGDYYHSSFRFEERQGIIEEIDSSLDISIESRLCYLCRGRFPSKVNSNCCIGDDTVKGDAFLFDVFYVVFNGVRVVDIELIGMDVVFWEYLLPLLLELLCWTSGGNV